MPNKSRPTFQKREKERARQQKQRDKQARLSEARLKTDGPIRTGDEDPDIAGIRPGPQPLPEQWHYGAEEIEKPEV